MLSAFAEPVLDDGVLTVVVDAGLSHAAPAAHAGNHSILNACLYFSIWISDNSSPCSCRHFSRYAQAMELLGMLSGYFRAGVGSLQYTS